MRRRIDRDFDQRGRQDQELCGVKCAVEGFVSKVDSSSKGQCREALADMVVMEQLMNNIPVQL